MNDPVSDRLRSYYVSIQRDPPPRLERSVIRAMETTPQKRGPSFTSVAFALIVAGAVTFAPGGANLYMYNFQGHLRHPHLLLLH